MRKTLVLALTLMLAVTALVAPAAGARSGEVQVEWLGWNAWRLTSPTGRVVLLNPFIEQEIPAAQVSRVSPGERVRADGVTVRVVNAIHGAGVTGATATTPSGGIAGSFFVTFENGWTIYFGGSGAATQDMALCCPRTIRT